MYRIESLLSARLFLQPQVVGDRVFFMSNLSGQISLYGMNYGGSVPEPLLPPNIALQNPHLIGGKSFFAFAKIGKILVMLDHDGDENYQPMLIPIDGGFPEPAFDNFFASYRCHLGECDPDQLTFAISAESRQEGMNETYWCSLETNRVELAAKSVYGAYPLALKEDLSEAILIDGYTTGDTVLYRWRAGQPGWKLFYGVPLEQRTEGQQVPLNSFFDGHYVNDNGGILLGTSLFEDTYGLGYISLDDPSTVEPVAIRGAVHTGIGEFVNLAHLEGSRFVAVFNIDACSWAYESHYDHTRRELILGRTICGDGLISNGVLESLTYDKAGDRFALAFSTATSPTQIYTVEGADRRTLVRHTNERILGIPPEHFSPGEDASFVSFDGTRTSARLYLPAASLGYQGPRPVVYYVHGGPQGQERPDFAWFSMPIIQFLTLNGMAVFVPNVRGSTGYGLNYTKQVDRDWGGLDMQDHVYALTEVLAKDARLDTRRSAVVGRSYGGYMTLMLAGCHAGLWSAAVDMFGPYDLLTFSDRIPPTWKPYFVLALGDPVKDKDFLVERSPKTHLHQLACPMLVIQGKNDPRVVEAESRDLVENLRRAGKEIEYLMFENEGHDVLKFENRVACYNAITDFFKKHLNP